MSNNISACTFVRHAADRQIRCEMDIDRARAVSDIAQTIINTARLRSITRRPRRRGALIADQDIARPSTGLQESRSSKTTTTAPTVTTPLPNGATVTRHKASRPAS